MGLFNTNLPYTNLHELNLDWLVREMKELKEELATIKSITPATNVSPMDGVGIVGTSTKYAREDHQHPTDTSRASQSSMNSVKGRLDVDEGNIETLFNTKQKKLVAGSNIVITSHSDYDTISATGEIAVDYPSISNKPTLNGVTIVGNHTSEDYNIYHKVMLYSDGTKICSDSTLETQLTYNQIKTLLDNATNDVELWNGNYILRPEYTTTQGTTSAIWFNGTTSLNNKTYLYRIAINSNNQVTNDEYELAQSSDIPSPYTLPIASANTLGGIKISNGLRVDPSTGETDVQPASAETIGGIMVGNGLSIDTDGVLSIKNENNAGYHNSIYRGKNIQSYYNDGTLFTRISSGSFDDLFIGDYFTITLPATDVSSQQSVTCMLAHFDYYYNCGDSALTTHQCVIVPTAALCNAKMEDSNITINGYYGSKMHQTTLTAINGALSSVFGSNLVSYRDILSTAGATSGASMAGAEFTGYASSWAWQSVTSRLMNEAQVYGAGIFSSSFYDYGCAKSQLALFRLDPSKIAIRDSWWLSAVASSTTFAYVNGSGHANNVSASYSIGVRPLWLIS